MYEQLLYLMDGHGAHCEERDLTVGVVCMYVHIYTYLVSRGVARQITAFKVIGRVLPRISLV